MREFVGRHRPTGDVRATEDSTMNLRKLLSPFASGLVALGAFGATVAITSSAPVGCITGILVSLVSGISK